MVLEDDAFTINIPVTIGLLVNFIYAVLENGDEEIEQKYNAQDDVDDSYHWRDKVNHRYAIFVVISRGFVCFR